MILKFLFLVLICIIPLQAYTEENGVLILNDDDLTNITEIFPHLFIKYYVTWYTCDDEGASIVKNWPRFLKKLLRNFKHRILQVKIIEISSFSED